MTETAMASETQPSLEQAREELEVSRVNVTTAEKEIQKITLALRNLADTNKNTRDEVTTAKDSGGAAAETDGDSANVKDKDEDLDQSNFLKITAVKVSGLPEKACPQFSIQLSSPIESQTIAKLYDSLDDNHDTTKTSMTSGEDDSFPAPPSRSPCCAIFRGVETTVATLVFEASDEDIPLGISAVYDVAPLCKVNALVVGGDRKRISEMEIAFVSKNETTTSKNSATESLSVVKDESETFMDALENEIDDKNEDSEKNIDKMPVEEDMEIKKVEAGESKDGNLNDENLDQLKQEEEATKQSDKKNIDTAKEAALTSSTSLQVPICTATFRIEFIPSVNELKSELYDLLNIASKKKATSIDAMRKAAAAVSRARTKVAMASNNQSSSDEKDNKNQLVKKGFLNKDGIGKKKREFFLMRWYNKTLGPQSLVRILFPVVKNYVIFFGAAGLMHYQGHQLALPPPV
mmetsp:Transcript_150/g.216  ORF Transcript_150/g.216 Transcript_150/m.216 type:complete len:463 (-) Transcript_150:67-1455(-)